MRRIARILNTRVFLSLTAIVLWAAAYASTRIPSLANFPSETCDLRLSIQERALILERQILFLTACFATLGLIASVMAGYITRRNRGQ